jgi:hypothetical protein
MVRPAGRTILLYRQIRFYLSIACFRYFKAFFFKNPSSKLTLLRCQNRFLRCMDGKNLMSQNKISFTSFISVKVCNWPIKHHLPCHIFYFSENLNYIFSKWISSEGVSSFSSILVSFSTAINQLPSKSSICLLPLIVNSISLS